MYKYKRELREWCKELRKVRYDFLIAIEKTYVCLSKILWYTMLIIRDEIKDIWDNFLYIIPRIWK
jgi:hypothetical protein